LSLKDTRGGLVSDMLLMLHWQTAVDG
jgi:hypothetical protein